MTNSSLTRLKVIADRSGSMRGLEQDMIGGLNAMFKEQSQQPGECLVDYVQFDTHYEEVFSDVPAANATAVLVPRGLTALLDAIGRGVTELGDKLKAESEDERAGTVIVVIVTDGLENSSREWTREKVKSLVEQQQKEWNWEFVFLGANMDAVAEGASLGISRDSTITYDTAYSGATVAAASNYVTQTRGGTKAAFTDDDREKATGKSKS